MAKKVILDVDTGTDDAVALMVAELSPDLELIGATTVNGNTDVASCTENTLRVFDYIGAEKPVFQGCPAAMVTNLSPNRKSAGLQQEIGEAIHGKLLDLPAAKSTKQEQHAVSWLIETYLKSDGDITLIPVGPLTNIAMAIRMEPRILEKIPEIVIMGGGVHLNNVSASAEFNFWVDPEAAKIVMNCGRPIRLVPLDATHRAYISREECQRLRDIGTPGAVASAIAIEHRLEGYNAIQPMEVPDTVPVHDALAVCSVIDPSVIETVHVNVDVDISGGIADGQSVCDMRGSNKKLPPNAYVAINADRQKYVDMLCEILGRII
jgi:inosine-uridine nucleoside N-ribohydrolase